MNAITKNRLAEIADVVNAEHDELETMLRDSMARAVKIGGLLTEAKKLAGHGNWGKWLNEYCHFSERTAQNYMRVFANYPELAKSATVADLTYKQALGLLTEAKTEDEPKTEIEKAKQYEKELLSAMSELDALNAELQGTSDVQRLIGIAKEAEQLYFKTSELKVRAERGAGMCFTILQQAEAGRE